MNEEMVFITSLVSRHTYDKLVVVAEREELMMNEVVEYCLTTIVDEFE